MLRQGGGFCTLLLVAVKADGTFELTWATVELTFMYVRQGMYVYVMTGGLLRMIARTNRYLLKSCA